MNLNLPKWPAFLVVGEPVTEDQAAEILIRTGGLTFSTNDKQFEKQLREVLGLPEDSYSLPNEELQKIWRMEEEVQQKYKVLNLSYLQNNQIVSCYIGGPKGWCDWDGNIGCNSYNIGKWPSVEEVEREWKQIAKEFPYLDLQCQLFNTEYSDETGVPIVQFDVKGGQVTVMELPEGTKPLTRIAKSMSAASLTKRLMTPYSERGCTIEAFKNALDITLKRLNEWNKL